MDDKEKKIVGVLLENNELRFEELCDKVLDRLLMDRKTFINRLRKLQSQGIVDHKKSKYFLVPLNRRKIYKNLNLEIQKTKKKISKLPKNRFFIQKSIELLEKIFHELYVPLQYERLCFLTDFSKGEKTKLENDLKRLEDVIIDLSCQIKKGQPGIEELLPPTREMIFIYKTQ